MKKKFISTFKILSILFLTSSNGFSQVQLIHNFIEENIIGDSRFGFSLSAAGDVNNDGYDDIIVGAFGYSNNIGRAYIYYGGNPMDNVPDVTFTIKGTGIQFGYSVSNAGDINSDGFDDVVIGIPGDNRNNGRALVYYGGAAMDNIFDITISGKKSGNRFGSSVSAAGDVNNDGFDDIVIGAPGYSTVAGNAYIFFGGNSMNYTADITIDAEGIDNFFGYSVSCAGDINNDGYDDVIVGAYGYNTGKGRAYIFLGDSSIDSTADIIIDGQEINGHLGCSVSTAGDINNDGFDDVIVGAKGIEHTYVFYGSGSMDTTADLTLKGEIAGSSFGFIVSTAGDINNDGFDDILVSANGYAENTGRVYCFYGSASMDSLPDIVMNGESGNNDFGRFISSAGDINNDGFDDLLVGDPGYNSSTGRSYVFYGGSPADSIADISIDGEGIDNRFGYSISSGDVNNDGYSDAIIGAFGYNSWTGRVYIFYGGNPMDSISDLVLDGQQIHDYFSLSLSIAGDVNNDGYDDILVGASNYNMRYGRAYIFLGGNPMDTIADIIIDGKEAGNYFSVSLSSAGDVNNDGFDDIIIGAQGYGINTGRAYIYYGGSSMDSIEDVKIDGEKTYDYFASSVADIGDINNDGYDDVLIGAYAHNMKTGKAYILFGGSSMDSIIDLTINGETVYNYFAFSASAAGDVNNDGGNDFIVSAYLNNNGEGRAYVFYGGNLLDTIPDVILNGENSSDYFGYSVAGNFDINNDGFNDIIAGAYGHNYKTGRAYIFYGGSAMDSIADLVMSGEGENQKFAYSVASAGDINNDGYDEVVVGAPIHPYNGKAYIYSTQGGTAIGDNNSKRKVLKDFILKQNYPNPFNPKTRISYQLKKSGHCILTIYDVLGKEVQILIDEYQSTGLHTLTFDGSALASGIYLYKLQTGDGFYEIKKMILIR